MRGSMLRGWEGSKFEHPLAGAGGSGLHGGPCRAVDTGGHGELRLLVEWSERQDFEPATLLVPNQMRLPGCATLPTPRQALECPARYRKPKLALNLSCGDRGRPPPRPARGPPLRSATSSSPICSRITGPSAGQLLRSSRSPRLACTARLSLSAPGIAEPENLQRVEERRVRPACHRP